MNVEKVHLLGWAFGNRVARATASLHPNAVATVILLAAGGKVPPSAETAEIMTTLFTSNNMPADQRAEFVQAAFYSPASDGAALERQFRGGAWRDARARLDLRRRARDCTRRRFAQDSAYGLEHVAA